MRFTVTTCSIRLQLHGAIYCPDSFVLMLYCANLKAIRYESTNLNRIVADKSHRVNAKIAPTLASLVKETRLSLHVGPTSCYYKSQRVNWPLVYS